MKVTSHMLEFIKPLTSVTIITCLKSENVDKVIMLNQLLVNMKIINL